MSFEADFRALLAGLAGGRIYPDVTPDNVVFPCIVFQQVGGLSQMYLEKKLPDKRHARMQVHVWARTRIEANAIARAAEVAICEGAMQCEPTGALTALYEEELKLYGTRQDFGCWFAYP